MDLHSASIDAVLLLQVGLQVAVLLILAQRGALLRFPCFSAYLLTEVVTEVVSTVLLRAGDSYYLAYFDFYWVSLGIILLLRAAVIREVLLGVFSRHEGLKSAVAIGWRWSVVAFLLAGLLAVRLLPGSEYTRTMNTLFAIARVLNGVQLGLILALFVMAASFALPWRNYYFGIALGFGFYAAASLAAFTLHTVGAHLSSDWLSWVEMTGYVASILVWLGFLWVREPVQVSELPADFALERWNQELSRMLNR